MQSASGWSLRLASAAFWVLVGLACSTFTCDVILARPSLYTALRSVFWFRVHYLMWALYICIAPTFLLQWWCMMAQKRKPPAALPALIKRLPAQLSALWLSSPYRLLKAVTLVACSTLCAVAFVQIFVENPLFGTTSSSTPLWYLSAPAGAAHAILYLASGLDRIVYPIMHRTRWLRLKESLPAVLALAGESWIYGSVAGVAFFMLAPSPLPAMVHLLRGVVGSFLFCFVAALSASTASIVLSERLYMQHLEETNSGSVRSTVRCSDPNDQGPKYQFNGVIAPVY